MIQLRPATAADVRLIYEWRNDPWIVSLSSGRQTVTWEEHSAWFSHRLADPDHRMYVVASSEGPAGVARLTRKGTDAFISVYLLRPFTGRGWGVQVIRSAVQAAFNAWPVNRVVAQIRKDNQPSLTAFAKAGFVPAEPANSCPENHHEMSIGRTDTDSGQTIDGHQVETGRLREHYLPLLREHGASHRAVDWGSAASQQLRFRVLLEIGRIENSSILDVGCGVGHLLDHLKKCSFTGSYLGLDMLAEMTVAAQARHPEAAFHAGPLAEAGAEAGADFVFGSGLFTFSNETGLRETVTRMYERCRVAVAFNTLSAWGGPGTAGEYLADPAATLQFCRALTPWVVLRHDYLPHDFTVYLYRQSPLQ